jgi:hypothetical protein
MSNRVVSTSGALIAPRPLPAWARAKGEISQDVDAAFLAGASLAALDACVRAETAFAGLWRNRLALRTAAAHLRLLGRREGETELRDGLALGVAGDAADGPAGGVLKAWRMLANRSTGISALIVDQAAAFLGLHMTAALTDILHVAEETVKEERPPLQTAAHVLGYIRRTHPRAEFLGFWLADSVLAHRLGWPIPLPLLVSGLAQRGRRGSVQVDEFGRMATAYAQAAAAAVDLYGELARRATKLLEAAPQLRAKGASAVVDALLEDDAVAPASRLGGMSDRGMRRLCDRLVALGAARELTGRPVFRLYGL